MSQPPLIPDSAEVIAALAAAANAKLAAGASINSAELGALLGIDERTVQAQARTGRYPSQQPTGPGGARRFSPANVTEIRAAIDRPAAVPA